MGLVQGKEEAIYPKHDEITFFFLFKVHSQRPKFASSTLFSKPKTPNFSFRLKYNFITALTNLQSVHVCVYVN